MSGEAVLEPRAPFPYFGGKRNAAQLVWDELGDCGSYVEPFCGSCAILLARPANHAASIETVNDADGMLVNVWRALRDAPDEVARVCADPVMECEYHARLAAIDRARADFVPWIEGDPAHFDARLAGYWIYCQSLSIGSIFDSSGPWRVIDGRLVDSRKLPHLGDPGKGVNRKLPHLGDPGKGVNRALPHLGNAGTGLSDAGVGINRGLPHLSDAGVGIGPRESSIRQYLRALARRLERVRIVCGDWKRVVASETVLFAHAPTAGVFLDPPYAGKGEDIYSGEHTGGALSAEVEEWAIRAGKDARVRIVLCGYDTEHDATISHGWRKVKGRAGGSGYTVERDGDAREFVWLSPGCVNPSPELPLFA